MWLVCFHAIIARENYCRRDRGSERYWQEQCVPRWIVFVQRLHVTHDFKVELSEAIVGRIIVELEKLDERVSVYAETQFMLTIEHSILIAHLE